MHRLRAWGIAPALLLGLAAAAAAAEPDAGARPVYGSGDGLLVNLFGGGHKAEPKADVKATDRAGDKGPTAANAPPTPSPAQARATFEREQQILLRRQKVCDQLRQIALEGGNADLERQADELDERAFAVFQQRTAGLAAVAGRKPAADRPQADRRTADRPAREDQP